MMRWLLGGFEPKDFDKLISPDKQSKYMMYLLIGLILFFILFVLSYYL
jgi:hypothetical protein